MSERSPQDRVRELEAELEAARRAAAPGQVRKFVTFAAALSGLRDGARFKRQGWDGALAAQVPDAGSKMTAPYLFFDDGRVRVPYVVSNDDLFADDWLLVSSPESSYDLDRRPDGTWAVDDPAFERWFSGRFAERFGRGPGMGEVSQFVVHVREHCEEQVRRNPGIKSFSVRY